MSAILTFLTAVLNSPSRVAFTTVSVSLFWILIAWSLGFVPALGAGFASAESVTSIQVSLVEDAIIERRIRYCEAPDGSTVKKFFLKIVNEKVIAYFKLTGTSYALPNCKELIVESTT